LEGKANSRFPSGMTGKDQGNGNSRSRFPGGMTERKARATTKAKARAAADSLRE